MLTRLPVRLAMRQNPLRISKWQHLNQTISSMIKYKVSAVLIYDDQGDQDVGLLTKTDLMTMYYGLLPLDTPLGDDVVAPIVGQHNIPIPFPCRSGHVGIRAQPFAQKKHRSASQRTARLADTSTDSLGEFVADHSIRSFDE
jgi:hypothetical protein